MRNTLTGFHIKTTYSMSGTEHEPDESGPFWLLVNTEIIIAIGVLPRRLRRKLEAASTGKQ